MPQLVAVPDPTSVVRSSGLLALGTTPDTAGPAPLPQAGERFVALVKPTMREGAMRLIASQRTESVGVVEYQFGLPNNLDAGFSQELELLEGLQLVLYATITVVHTRQTAVRKLKYEIGGDFKLHTFLTNPSAKQLGTLGAGNRFWLEGDVAAVSAGPGTHQASRDRITYRTLTITEGEMQFDVLVREQADCPITFDGGVSELFVDCAVGEGQRVRVLCTVEGNHLEASKPRRLLLLKPDVTAQLTEQHRQQAVSDLKQKLVEAWEAHNMQEVRELLAELRVAIRLTAEQSFVDTFVQLMPESERPLLSQQADVERIFAEYGVTVATMGQVAHIGFVKRAVMGEVKPVSFQISPAHALAVLVGSLAQSDDFLTILKWAIQTHHQAIESSDETAYHYEAVAYMLALVGTTADESLMLLTKKLLEEGARRQWFTRTTGADARQKPNTPHIAEAAVKAFATLHNQGHDLRRLLELTYLRRLQHRLYTEGGITVAKALRELGEALYAHDAF
jgi:hypothetical protein